MVSAIVLIIGLTVTLFTGAIIGYTVMIYNGLIRLRRKIDKSWSNIDVLLKQRNDELPKLIDTAQQYMDYEENVMQEITKARNEAQKASSPAQQADAEETMQNALGNFFAVAEEYPDLKTTQQFQKIQKRISQIETRIADRRELYNQAVNTFNIRINQIPYNVMANLMGYSDKELFQVEDEERTDVDISKQFQP